MTESISFPSYSTPTSSGGYGAVAPPARRGKAGEWCVDKMALAVIVAFFIAYLMPQQIAPSLGISPEAYQSQLMLWSVLAGLLAMPFAWIASKIIAKMIRS